MIDKEKARGILGQAHILVRTNGYDWADDTIVAVANALQDAEIEGAKKMRNAIRVKLWEATIRDSDTAIDVVDTLDPEWII